MAFIPTPNAVRVSVEFQWGSVTAVLTLWFEGIAPFSQEGLEDFGDELRTWVTGDLMPELSTEISATGITLVAQDSASSPSVFVPIAPPVAGVGTGGSVPTSSAAVVTFRTPFRGRSFRGRNYIPGVTDAAQASAGVLSAGTVTGLLSAYTALAVVADAAGVDHVVASRVTGGAPRTQGLTTPITAYSMDTPLRSQRRRQVGVGI